MITGIVRASYAKVWEAAPDLSGNLKFSISLLIPKKDKATVKAIKEAIDTAIHAGVEKGKFSKAALPHLKRPLRDGDAEIAEGKKDDAYAGMYFINCSSARPPGIVDKFAKPIMNQNDFYSGCWCRADINFFPFAAAGNKGVGVGLNNLMKVKDDTRWDGALSAESAFKGFSEELDEDAENEDMDIDIAVADAEDDTDIPF